MYIIPVEGLRFIVSDVSGLDTLDDLGVPLPDELCGEPRLWNATVRRRSGATYRFTFSCRPRRLRSTMALLQRFHTGYYGDGVVVESPQPEVYGSSKGGRTSV